MKRAAPCLLLAAGLVTPAFGAGISLTVGDVAYYLDTTTGAGRCTTEESDDGFLEAVCRDGANVVAVDSRHGCLDSTGAGYCALGRDWKGGPTVNQLNCPDGRSFYLASGVESENDCRLDDGHKICRSSDGGSFAEADCTGGCGASAKAGMCCMAGTTGCPPSGKTEASR